MSLVQKVNGEIGAAMKAGDALRLTTLRMLSAAFKNKEIEKRGRGEPAELTDEEAIEVIKREVKKRREAAEIFGKANRLDLAEKEKNEFHILSHYLPPQMSEEEIGKVVDAILQKNIQEFGAVMKEAMKELRGRADGSTVSGVIKKKIG